MRVVWTPEAQQDRADVWDYIAADNPRAAARMDEIFSDAAARLIQHPMLGKPGKIPGTRELIPHESYRLVYQIDGALTDCFRARPRSAAGGQLRTVKHLPGSGRSIVSLTCFAPSMKGGRWPIRALTACQ